MSIHQPLDLYSTLYSGQSFRWRRDGNWSYGVVFDNIVRIRQLPEGIEFISAPDDEAFLEPLLKDYLGLAIDLEDIYATFADDERMVEAISRYRGMRITRQDPWECLISFICSSASNIPRISRNVESLCSTFGRPLRMGDYARNTFPTPQELAGAGEQRLRLLGLGYRARYVSAAANAIADGKLDLMALREESYEVALDALTALDGVGDKVTNCVLLTSLDKLEAFPVDVWIQRALQEWYLEEWNKNISKKNMRLWAQNHFGSFAGYANQYLFHSRRLKGRSYGTTHHKSD